VIEQQPFDVWQFLNTEPGIVAGREELREIERRIDEASQQRHERQTALDEQRRERDAIVRRQAAGDDVAALLRDNQLARAWIAGEVEDLDVLLGELSRRHAVATATERRAMRTARRKAATLLEAGVAARGPAILSGLVEALRPLADASTALAIVFELRSNPSGEEVQLGPYGHTAMTRAVGAVIAQALALAGIDIPPQAIELRRFENPLLGPIDGATRVEADGDAQPISDEEIAAIVAGMEAGDGA
jgi:hypothetical protein